MLIEFGCKDTTFLLNIITFGRYFIKIFYSYPCYILMCFLQLYYSVSYLLLKIQEIFSTESTMNVFACYSVGKDG